MKGSNFKYIVVVWDDNAPEDEYETVKGFYDVSSALSYMDSVRFDPGVMASIYESKLTFWL